MSDSGDLGHVDWEDYSELHKADDGGGVLSSFKSIRQGVITSYSIHYTKLYDSQRPPPP